MKDLFTIAMVIYFIVGLIQKAKQATEQAASAGAGDGQEPTQAGLFQVREQLGEQIELGRAHIKNARALEKGLTHAKGPVERLRQTLQNPIISDLERALSRLQPLGQALGGSDEELVAILSQSGNVGTLFQTIYHSGVRLDAMRALVKNRADQRMSEVLADADAIAEGFLSPLRKFCGAHGISFPDQHPICTPADPGGEMVLYALFPGHPVLFVPEGFETELLRWPSLAHEVGHIMWRMVPGFAREAAWLAADPADGQLARQMGRELVFNPDGAVAVWLAEMVSDLFSVLLMGPAGLRGMAHAFQSPKDPQQALMIHGDREGLAEHPPSHLRILLGVWMLERMGYLEEPRQILKEWTRIHGEPDALLLPTLSGRLVQLPIQMVLEPAKEILEQVYSEPFRSLAGYALTAIPGLELSPGVWARVGRRAKDLIDDTPFNDSPRVVITAGVEAGAQKPGSHLRIAKGVRRAILGLDNNEHRVADAHYQERSTQGWNVSLADIRDALVLREAWLRKAPLGGGPGRSKRGGDHPDPRHFSH